MEYRNSNYRKAEKCNTGTTIAEKIKELNIEMTSVEKVRNLIQEQQLQKK